MSELLFIQTSSEVAQTFAKSNQILFQLNLIRDPKKRHVLATCIKTHILVHSNKILNLVEMVEGGGGMISWSYLKVGRTIEQKSKVKVAHKKKKKKN